MYTMYLSETAHFNLRKYERISKYDLDLDSYHPLKLETLFLVF